MTDRTESGEERSTRETGPGPRSLAALLLLLACAAFLFAGFVALGTWQVHRLSWKKTLIERVDQRVHAAPVGVPGPERWAQVTAEADEYRRVRLSGTYLHELSTLVQASTRLGSGYWLITPLRDIHGNVYLINRGFLSPRAAAQLRQQSPSSGANGGGNRALPPAAAETTVTGLLRISEPEGGFLRKNNPAQDKWYSRDVAAIAAARGLVHVAPFFVDADANPPEQVKSAAGSSDGPVGGLTVISFPNNHLTYALTWYALALMVAGAGLWVAREEYRNRRGIRSRRRDADRTSADGRND